MLTGAGSLLLALAAGLALESGVTWGAVLPGPLPGATLALGVDGLSAYFVLVIGVVAFAVSVYAAGYVRHYAGRPGLPVMTASYPLFVLSIVGVICAANALSFLILWETMLHGLHPTFPSVTPVVPTSHWYEREVKDMLGLKPAGHPDPRRLVLHDGWPRGLHPLRKDFDATLQPERAPHREGPITGVHGEGVFEIPVGPIHAGIIEPGHFRFGVVGELVLQLEARLFYTHRGIEKSMEGRSVEQALFLAERICGVCSLSHATSFCQAIEQLAGAVVPPRPQPIHSILLELERLYNHVGDIGNICAGTGFQLGVYQGGRLKELLQQLNERVTGHRYLFSVNWPGGVRRDLTEAQAEDIRATVDLVERDFRNFVQALFNNDSFVERIVGTGVLAPEVARDLGAVGVAARASGVDRDTRCVHPYAAYGLRRLRTPLYRDGDVRARILVRIEEALASFSLVRSFLARLEPGPIGPLPPERWAMGITESPRGGTSTGS